MAPLEAMRDALRHRGPDDTGISVIGNVGLVHTRLSIVDVSERGHQPMAHPNGRVWMSYNGEVFNHESLRAELPEAQFTSTGDTETVLHGLAMWGVDVLPRLNGQFAFAALDLDRGTLLLARDRFGIKPLYIAHMDDVTWFASEPGALLAAGVPASPGPLGWETILDFSCYRTEETLVAAVERVHPGSYVEIALDGSAFRKVRWDTTPRHVDSGLQVRLAATPRRRLVAQLTDTLRAAVHEALLGDVPMGTLCSGGVDSGVVTALAAEAKPDLIAFAARYRGDRALDEGPAAQRVADALNVELDMLEVEKHEWRSGFVDATLHFGAPIATASSVTIAQMAERARRRGVKVLLTGEGADELFGGYMSPFGGPLAEFLPLPHQAWRLAEPLLLGHPARVAKSGARQAVRLVNPRFRSHAVRPEDLADQPSGGHDLEMLTELQAAYSWHTGCRHAIESALLRDMHNSLSHLLNRMDENMMQVSVEARVPFLDPRVVALALNLPLEARVGPWNKGILRDVARTLLPWRIAHRAKLYGMDFDAGRWIEEAADPTFLRQGMLRDIFRIPAEEFDQVVNNAFRSLRVRLWSAEVWCRATFGGESPETIEKALWLSGP